MFRAYLGPSSEGTTVYIQQLVIVVLFRWLSVVLDGLESNSHPTRTTDSHLKRIIGTNYCIHTVVSWWWAWIRPEHVDSNPPRTTDSHLKRIINTNCCIHTVVSWWWAWIRPEHIDSNPSRTTDSSKKNNKYQLLYTYSCLLMMGLDTPGTCRFQSVQDNRVI